ncbi:MAG: RDD family protein [Acidobacteriota bacterium]|nr:RDD family protein [Acidobacteriota bacterium]
MSSRVERTAPLRSFRSEKVVVNFDARRLKAPFSLRCGAILIDYILLVTIPVVSLLLGRFFDYDGTKLLNSEVSSVGWLIMILLALTNFFIFPLLTGQSIGKMLTGLKVVKTDGSEAQLKNLLIRHLIGYPLMFLTLGLGFLISVFSQKGRALHDFLAGTVVIYGRRQTREIQS